MKFLIVDDEADIGFVVSFELKTLGHETVSLGSVAEAISYLREETPDVILCDYQMPKASGLELLTWLRLQDKRIPFYLLTGEPVLETKDLLKDGVENILFKPQDLLKLSTLFKHK
jgi:two-component system chemotaxis response regulator CheY